MRPSRLILLLGLTVLLVGAVQSCSLLRRDPVKLQASADDALARGDTARSIKLLDRSLRSGDGPADRYAQLGRLYRESGTISGRFQSQQVLEKGLQTHAANPSLWLEMGKTHYAQTFYGDAKRCFEKALVLDPGNCEAQFYIGINWVRKWKWIQTYKEYLRKAIPYLQHVVECDPQNKEAMYKLAFAAFARGDTLSGLVFSERFIDAHPDVPEGYFLRGTIAYRRLDYALSDSLFGKALALLPEEEINGYSDISHLLSDEAAAEYESASDTKRRTLERIFWAERDPDPTTPLNEHYLEHIHRMYLADAFFDNATPRLRGWETERGKAVIKFGWPDGVGSTLSGGSLTGPMEVWRYQNQFVGMTLVFRDEFLNGNYMVPMDHRYAYVAQTLYLEPPASHYVSPYWEIPGVMDVISFRGARSSADVYLSMRVDLETMGEYIDFSVSDRFFVRTAFFDEEWRPALSQVDTLHGRVFVEHRQQGDDWLYLLRAYEMPFDSLRVAFCIEDDLQRIQSIISDATNTERYLTDRLVLSDILLYEPTPDETTMPLIQRGSNVFTPNPGGIYRQAEKLRLYVEVYNLNVRASRSDYEITYSIYAADDAPGSWIGRVGRGLKNAMGFRKPPEPIILQTLQRQGSTYDAGESIAVDIGALASGDYVLKVGVRDQNSGEEAQRTRAFIKSARKVLGVPVEE